MTPSFALLLVWPFSILNRPRRTTIKGARSGLLDRVAVALQDEITDADVLGKDLENRGLGQSRLQAHVQSDEGQGLVDPDGLANLDLAASVRHQHRVWRSAVDLLLQHACIDVDGCPTRGGGGDERNRQCRRCCQGVDAHQIRNEL